VLFEKIMGFGEGGAELNGRLDGLLSLVIFPEVKIEDTQVKVNFFILGVNFQGLLIALERALVLFLPAEGHSQAVIKMCVLGSLVNGLKEEFFGHMFQAGGQEGFGHFGAAAGGDMLADAPGILKVLLGAGGVAILKAQLPQLKQAFWI
jgi:hypothetical protein